MWAQNTDLTINKQACKGMSVHGDHNISSIAINSTISHVTCTHSAKTASVQTWPVASVRNY